MRLRGSLGLLALTAWLTACASSTTPAEGGAEGGADTVNPPTDRPNPPTDNPNPGDGTVVEDTGVAEDTGIGDDVIVPMDSGVGDDVVSPPDTGVPPMDVVGPIDTGVPPTDSGVGPADTGVDVIPGPVCPAVGLNENCPAMGSTGPCAPLTAGTRTINFATSGLMPGIAASCEGMFTSMGPDGVVPLVITSESNVAIRVEAIGSGSVTATLFNGAGCGVATQQRGCVNTNNGGPVTLTANNLAPGMYWVAFSAAGNMGGPLPLGNITTTITPAPPRLPGDTCPGVTVPTDGTTTTINSMMFQRVGNELPVTGCTNIGPSFDMVFSFTIAATSDVNIDVRGPAGTVQAINLDVQGSCGTTMRVRDDLTCTSTNSATALRTLRRLAPGTYWVVSQVRTGGGTNPASMFASVTAMPSPPTDLADMCPGRPLSAGVQFSSPVTSLAQDTAFACFPASSADGNYSFNAPAGQDVLVEAFAGTNQTAVELREPCGMNPMACTAPSVPGRSWQRYAGLAAGRSYTLHAGTNAAAGNLDVIYRTIAPLPTTAIAGNEACMTARTIPATGGVFTGNTAMMAQNSAAPAFGGNSCNQCNTVAGRDAVYQLVLTARTRVLAKLNGAAANFDPVIYVRQGTMCNDGNSGGSAPILFCADDYYGQNSAFDRVLDPGTYSIFVDDCVPFMGGGSARGGAYSLEVITLAP
ncbi:MAG: hypothetical protein JNK05_27900 [Myxococcales bacterium]|nr:hypothetical protein [Myxococcales bacterium]